MSRFDEIELNRVFNRQNVEAFRTIQEVVAPSVVSLDITEIESLIHEFRLVRTRFDDLYQKITVIPSVISANYTTRKNEILICTAELTVTLNPTPKDREKVTVKRNTTAGYTTVSGTIDGDSSFIMVNNYDSFTFVYLAENAEWSVI